MKNILNKIPLLLILTFTVLLIGCAPKEDPAEVLNSYYENIKNSNIEAAYNILCKQSKKNFSKDDFIKWQNTTKETLVLKDVKIEKNNEYKNKTIDGIKFKNVVEFNVVEKTKNLYENKEDTINYKRNVVNDNGLWKIYRGKENAKDLVSNSLNQLAWMYIDGKGKTKDLNQAASLLNEALKENSNFSYTYYTLGVTYTQLDRNDEAINSINKYLEKVENNESKSNGYNVLGVAYESKGEYGKSKNYYNEAIKLDPNNQYAKTNLERVKQY